MGSNLGDRLSTLRSARSLLAGLGRISAASHLYRSAAVGGPAGQGEYLNAVVALAAGGIRGPRELLAGLLAIEEGLGRTRGVRWEARTLDLDLLDFGGMRIDEPGLELPHPRLLERAFVLAPLCEIYPGWRHPVTGVSACEAFSALEGGEVARTGLAWDPG